jgi:hypothetical protein
MELKMKENGNYRMCGVCVADTERKKEEGR